MHSCPSIFFRMRITYLFSTLALVCFLLSDAVLGSPLLAQTAEVVTIDTFDGDARLKQSVTLHAEGVPVGELLILLSKKTGVALKADPYVADDKIVAFSPARPLRDILRDIAALYNDVWQASPPSDGKTDGKADKKTDGKTDGKTLNEQGVEAQTRYVLTRRLSARHYEDSLEQAVTTRMLALLEAQVKALSETPEELAKRSADDLIRKNLEDPSSHGRQATGLYAQLSPEQRATLFSEGTLNLSFAVATPAQQQMLRDAFTEVVTTLKAIDDKQRAEFPEVHILIDAPESLVRHGLQFRLTRTNNAGLSALVVQVILGENTYMTMGVFENDSQWLLPAHGNPYTRKSIARTAAFPAIEVLRNVDRAGANSAWIDRLSALSEAAKRPVFADYYRSPVLVHDLKTAPLTPSEASLPALDAFCKSSGYLWWLQDQTLLLRKRDWYAQRRYEVSDRWMRDMQRRLRRQKNIPTYADLCQLSELTPAQIAGINGALEPTDASSEDRGNAPKFVDLQTQVGLHELLAVIQATFDPAALLPDSEVTGSNKTAEDNLTENSKDRLPGFPGGPVPALNPQQATLVGAFLQTMRQANLPGTRNSFTVQAFCTSPIAPKLASVPDFHNVQVTLIWKVREGKARVASAKGAEASNPPIVREQRWMLWLPLQLPDDRSEKTKIDILP